ncbi:hypothetical protein GCM10009722_29070 [Williamsia deligens]
MLAALSITGVVVGGWLLGWPGWVIPPAVVVVLLVAGLAAWPRTPVASRSGHTRTDVALGVVAVVVVGMTCLAAAIAPRGSTGPGAGPASLRDRASSATSAYLTVAPGASASDAVAARLRTLAPLLTGRALADLRSQGPDSALPGATATGSSQEVSVQSVGLATLRGDSARMMLFATVRVTVPTATPPASTASIARWVVMRRVDGTWRLADIYPVGPGG